MPDSDVPRQTDADGPSAEILARYLAGESAPDEMAAVRAWLGQNPEQARSVQVLESAVAALARSAPAADVDVDAALAKLHARIAADDRVRPISAAVRRPKWRVYAGLAAAAGIVLGAGGYLMRPELANWRPMIPGGRPNFSHMYNSAGHMQTVRLADGTVALMAPYSTLDVAGDYNKGNRRIQASGLVRFDVHHNAHVPFIVDVGPATITDVGTIFVVRSFNALRPITAHDTAWTDIHVVVSVTQGKVRLSSNDRTKTPPVELRAGERGSKMWNSPAERLSGPITAADTSWTHGDIVFEDTPLSTAMVDLSQWYRVKLRVDDPILARRRLTGSFNGADPLERVLSTMALAVDAHVDSSAGVFSLRPNSTH